MNSPVLRIRPLQPGEVLDETVLLLRQHSGLFLRVVLWIYLPGSLLLQLLLVPWQLRATAGETFPPADVFRMMAVFAAVVLVDEILLRQLARGTLFSLCGQIWRGEPASLRQAILRAARRLPAAGLATLLCGGLYGLSELATIATAFAEPAEAMVWSFAALPLFLFGFLLVVCTWLVVPVIQLEGRGVVKGFIRGIRLTMAGLPSVLAIVFALLILRLGVTAIAALISNLWLQTILAVTIDVLLLIPETVSEAVLLTGLRARVENFDLELLAHEVEQTAPP